MRRNTFLNFFKSSRKNVIIAAIGTVLVFLAGYGILQTNAAGFFAFFDASGAQVSGNATVVADSSASSGKAIQFTAPSTPPPTGGGSGSCPAFPAFPDAQCTGWQHTGVTLRSESAFPDLTYDPGDGNIVIAKQGTVIDGLDTDKCIFIKANNVTIKRSRVRGSCSEGTISAQFGNYTNILIEDVEVDGRRLATGYSGIGGTGFTCRRCNIHDAGSSIRAYGDVKIYDSYLHDNSYGGDSHNSAVSMRGDNIEAIHNNMRCDASWNCSGVFQIYAKDVDSGRINNILAKNNLFYSSTGYCVYGGWTMSGGSLIGQASNVRILDNAFLATTQWPDKECGDIGAVAGWPTVQQASANGNVWSGNYRFPNAANIINP